MLRFIDQTLLDAVSREAQASPRRRKNRNFHRDDQHPAHRLLNAIEPGSYVMPHRHLNRDKDETMVVLRGKLAFFAFDDAGNITAQAILSAGGDKLGIDIPHARWHTVVALEPGTLFFEAKAGPYQALTADEKAAWAPEENTPEAANYLASLNASLTQRGKENA